MLACTFFQSSVAKAATETVVSEPEEKQIIVYEEFTFTEQKYEPSVEMPAIKDYKNASLATPEDVLFARYAAFLSGDMDWANRLLVESDKRMLESQKADERENRIASLKKQIETLLKGNKVVLKKKITVSQYVIIDYSIVKSAKESISLFAVFVQEQNSWKMCRTCGLSPEHPLHPFIVNANFRFSESEKKITNVKLNSNKPDALHIKIRK
jgi:hypothetical protein